MPKGKSALAAINATLSTGAKKGGKKKGKKGRKIGRSSRHPAAQRYKAEKRWESNKIRKVRKHVKKHSADDQARTWLASHDSAARAFLAGLPRE